MIYYIAMNLAATVAVNGIETRFGVQGMSGVLPVFDNYQDAWHG